MANTTNYVAATGNVGGPNGGEVKSIVLTGGSDAATLTLRESGSGGSTIYVVKAAASSTVVVPCLHAVYAGQLHATLAGTGPVATIEL